MTLRLILTRHAKSSWDDHDVSDFDRPINLRGVDAASNMGRWVSDHGYEPEQLLCSKALRALQTLEGLTKDWSKSIPCTYSHEMYLASPGTMLSLLSEQSASTTMLIGHNPGMGAMAAGLVQQRPGDADFIRYPTCAMTVLEFDISEWNEIEPASGRLIAFMTPKGLPPTYR